MLPVAHVSSDPAAMQSRFRLTQYEPEGQVAQICCPDIDANVPDGHSWHDVAARPEENDP
jgi:hypothetical protein